MKGFNPNPNKDEKLNSLKYQVCRILLAVRLGRLDASTITPIFTTNTKNYSLLKTALKEIENDGLTDGVEYSIVKELGMAMVVFDFMSNPDKKSPLQAPSFMSLPEYKENFL